MLRTIALTILITFSASTAFALSATEILTKGKILGVASASQQNPFINYSVIYNNKLYWCQHGGKSLQCIVVKKDNVK